MLMHRFGLSEFKDNSLQVSDTVQMSIVCRSSVGNPKCCFYSSSFVLLSMGGESEPSMAVDEHVVKRSIHHIFLDIRCFTFSGSLFCIP